MFKSNGHHLLTCGLILIMSHTTFAAPRFSGGLCQSQGNWVKTALESSESVTNALMALKDDPACKALIDAVQRSPQIDATTRDGAGTAEVDSYVNVNQELAAISSFLKAPTNGVDQNIFQQLVYQVAFNKSFNVIKTIKEDAKYASMNLTDSQAQDVQMVGDRIKSFLNRSAEVAKVSMATTTNILQALPQSQTCLHNRPEESSVIFSSLVGTAASLLSSGRMNGVPEFISSLMTYSREMSYIKFLTPIEQERFNTTVSCLIESTSETYCSMVDAEQALNVISDENHKMLVKETVKNQNLDAVANPLAGMIILIREMPVIQNWSQKVLFGIEPRLAVEAQMKNNYWQGFVGFLTSVNTLKATFRDKEQIYLQYQGNLDNPAKLSQIKGILDSVISVVAPQFSRTEEGINFYTQAIPPERIPFFLIGKDQLPADFNERMKTFDTFYTNWTNDGSNGFNDPDALLETVKARLWILMDKAQTSANTFFASRMIVDSQNLVAEAMKGPGVSPYVAFVNTRKYLQNLSTKLRQGVQYMNQDPELHLQANALKTQISLIQDSVNRLTRIINGLDKIAADSAGTDTKANASANQEVMNIIYDTANMMVSRDSFFATRLQTLVQADLSDTLIRNKTISEYQKSLLYSLGRDILTRLSEYFGGDPVSQRLDVSQAKNIQIANLQSVEGLFAKVVFSQLVDLTCKLEGGYSCYFNTRKNRFDPAGSNPEIISFNESIKKGRANKGLAFKYYNWLNPATENSESYNTIRAKLCIQSLAFESREKFATLCQGQVLKSDFKANKSLSLDLSYDQELSAIRSKKSTNGTTDFEAARVAGVCSFRTYLRRNTVYRMYNDFLNADTN